jgi:hypothetical protein
MRRSPMVAAAIAVLLAGCSDTTVGVGEVKRLEDLTDVRVSVDPESVPVGDGKAMTGVVTYGSLREDFAVLVGETTPGRVSIRGRTYRLSSGCAGAGVYASGRGDVAYAVESAVYEMLAPDAECHG